MTEEQALMKVLQATDDAKRMGVPKGNLQPCPFCGKPATITPIARSWWTLKVPHTRNCFLSDFEYQVPRSAKDLKLMEKDWNTRKGLKNG